MRSGPSPVYTPVPRSMAVRRYAFEYLALVRIKVESSYMGFNDQLNSSLIRSAVLRKPAWLEGEWNPSAANNQRLLPVAALMKVSAYLGTDARISAASADELELALAERYADAYMLQAAPAELRKIAVFRCAAVIDEDGDPSWEHRMVTNGDLGMDFDKFQVPLRKKDDLTIFLQGAARVDVLRKLELIESSSEYCLW